MTQDEIIRMAQESDMDLSMGVAWADFHTLERFAALVAAHEREKLAEQSQLADASLEPVAWIGKGGFNTCGEGQPLYAAPVRTKDPCNPLQDLTDDELCEIEKSHLVDYRIPLGGQYDFARAVIAKFKEKNCG